MSRHFPKGTRFITIDANPFDDRAFVTESDIESDSSDWEKVYHVDRHSDDTFFFYMFMMMCAFIIATIFML